MGIQQLNSFPGMINFMQPSPLQYYDPSKTISIHVDASRKGLSTCLIQDRLPITFMSKSLMVTETCYINIERELVVVVMCGCMRCHTYLYGRSFTLKSNHKPLVMISMKMSSQYHQCYSECCSPCIHITWSTNTGHVFLAGRNKQEFPFDIWIDHITFSKPCLCQIRKETVSCLVLSVVYHLTHHGWQASHLPHHGTPTSTPPGLPTLLRHPL